MKNIFLHLHLESKKWSRSIQDVINFDRISACILKQASFLSPPDFYKKNNSLCANVILVDDAYNKQLNTDFRKKEKTTNVLSFPVYTLEEENFLNIGDIYLAYETIAREAEEQKKKFANHVVHLSIHGVLHLLGYDHQKEVDAFQMESLEKSILKNLNISNPYTL